MARLASSLPAPLAPFLLAVALAVPPALSAQSAPRIAVRLPSFQSTLLLDTVAAFQRTEHGAPPATVWPLLVDAVRSIDPELATAGGVSAGWLGTTQFVPGRRLGGEPLSRWLECGAGITGRHADTDRIALAFAVVVDSLPGQRTRLGWALAGSAQPRTGESRNALTCETTGALEAEVRRRIEARLGATVSR